MVIDCQGCGPAGVEPGEVLLEIVADFLVDPVDGLVVVDSLCGPANTRLLDEELEPLDDDELGREALWQRREVRLALSFAAGRVRS